MKAKSLVSPIRSSVDDKSVPNGAVRSPTPPSEWVAGVRQGILIGAAILAITLPPAGLASRVDRPAQAKSTVESGTRPISFDRSTHPSTRNSSIGSTTVLRHADFRGVEVSDDARQTAQWIAESGDNASMSFVILDKRQAAVYVFDRNATLTGASPVLLGFAPGDDSAEGIGDRPLDQVSAHEKTTPAGRFVGERGHDTTGEDVVWVDYDLAVAMHRVRVVDPKERRLERLKSPNPADRRISFGCINVPVAFFEGVVAPVFRGQKAVVYVLPETKSLAQVFGGFATAKRQRSIDRSG